ncbi:MAG TPA: SCP2 sterol-binding domain-containing protein [Candidatus Thermoplasmatota archaeon]|jgi:putative sterol carrier protein|nr:SCP2 sterol-binding domain-containing protein [Candidatus Thermoplasmatota archaeon]
MTVTTVQEAVDRIVNGFRKRYDASPELRQKLKGKNRIVLLDVTDGAAYTFHVEDGNLVRVESERHPKPDASMSVSTKDLLAILNKELPAMRAYLEKRVKVKASFTDILFVKSLLG